MSSEGIIEKPSNSLHRTSTLISQKNELTSFTQKMKEIKYLLRQYVSSDKFSQLQNHLEELNQIYNSDIVRQRGTKQKGQQQREGMTSQKATKKSEKVILEVMEGKKIQNQIKIEGETRGPRSPQKKVEEKRFVKFEPKRATTDNQSNFVGLRKNSPNK